jgi:hypothetical protein
MLSSSKSCKCLRHSALNFYANIHHRKLGFCKLYLQTQVDLLQLMLNAEADHEDAVDEDTATSDTTALNSSSGVWKRGIHAFISASRGDSGVWAYTMVWLFRWDLF